MGLQLVQMDADDAYAAAKNMLNSAGDIPEDTRVSAAELLDGVQRDLNLVKRGHGLHNVTYAIELLDSVASRSRQVVQMVTEAQQAQSQADEPTPDEPTPDEPTPDEPTN